LEFVIILDFGVWNLEFKIFRLESKSKKRAVNLLIKNIQKETNNENL